MVRLKSQYTVKPAEPTPNVRISLSNFDQIKPTKHVPLIYFYRTTTTTTGFSVASAIETLRSSLSQSLVYFYPLAGRLHWSTSGGGRVELQCNAMGARLYEAESDTTLDDFGDFRPTPDLRSLIPSVDYSTVPLHELPLLLVQLTKFSCGGISLGLAVPLNLVDGTSAFHFISQWARIARGEPLDIIVPFLDRTVLLPPWDPPAVNHHNTFAPPPLLIGELDDKHEREKETTVTMLHLSKTHVEKLKNMANASRAANIRPYSRFEAVAGHIWRCTCKAGEHKTEQLTNLRVPVDCRHRMRPPLPQGYFGNAVLRAVATSRSGELVTKPLGYASSRIREAVEKITNEYVRSAVDFVENQPKLNRFREFHSFYGNPNLEITSWVGQPINGADFGWGKEIYMGPGALNFDGKCFLLPAGHDGDGSLVIPLRLQVAHMESFKTFFYEGMQGRSYL